MRLKVVTKEGSEYSIESPADFERVFGVRYFSGIQCDHSKTQMTIERRHVKALARGWITPRQKWLGHYFADGFRGKMSLDLTISWIDRMIGYGLWTNRRIACNTFIGEYTGLLRKRRFWKRWENLYCFDYTIGERRSSSYVIDAQDFGNHIRYINHSFNPNLETVSVYYEGMIRVIVYAKTVIPAGTQLFYDYGEEYWEKRSGPKELSSCHAGISFR